MRVDYVLNIDTISRFNGEHHWGVLCDHLKKLRIFTLTSSNFLHRDFDSETWNDIRHGKEEQNAVSSELETLRFKHLVLWCALYS